MSRGGERQCEFYDSNMRLPPALLHFFPVALALFTLTISVAGHSIFFGFDEDEPITWMSLSLMLVVLVFLVAVIRDPSVDPFKRRTAIALSAVAGFAVLDERLKWHEDFGKYVKDELEIFTRDIRHYTDDVVVILFALAGAVLFYVFVRNLPNRRDYFPYIACVVALALAHGVLDVLGHGGRLWRKVLTPGITGEQVDLLTETLGFFEEACKLWTEWFVLLFVLRFLYGQKGPLAWSLLVMAGSFLAGLGLWAIEDPNVGIPYLVMGKTLRLLRNYHLLFTLMAIFSAWAVVSWRLFGSQPKKQALAGLFFLTPYYALLPEITAAATSMLAMVRSPLAALLGLAVLGMAAWAWQAGSHRQRLMALAAITVALGLFGFAFAKLSGQPFVLLSIGGVLFPWAVVALLADKDAPRSDALADKDAPRSDAPRRRAALIVALVLGALLVQNPLGLLVAFAGALTLSIQGLDLLPTRKSWAILLVSQALVITGVYVYSASGILPEYRFEAPETVLFETGTQTVDPDYYRSEE
ncbi:MAG: hypothetical protein AAF657_33030 [Acidobacteriota bacterium]